MALISINQPAQPKEKASTLEKIALATDIASKVLGTAFEIPAAIQKRRTGKAEEEKTKAETKVLLEPKAPDIQDLLRGQQLKEYEPPSPEEIKSFQSLSPEAAKIVPRTRKDLADYARTILGRQPGLEIQREKLGMTREEMDRRKRKAELPTQPEIQSAGFAARAQDADRLLEKYEKKAASMMTGNQKYAPSFLQSKEIQTNEQAKKNFLIAVLRKESGAAITKEEMAQGDLQYFAQPGDSVDVLNAKKQNRMRAIEGFKASAGKRGIEHYRKIQKGENIEIQDPEESAPSIEEADAF